MNAFPVVTGASYFLAHVPGLVRHGSKPQRELVKDPGLLPTILEHLRSFPQARAYAPHQVFIGNLRPDDLRAIPRPWYCQTASVEERCGPFGEIMPEQEFLAILKLCDEFNLVLLEHTFVEGARAALEVHPLIHADDLERIGLGVPLAQIEAALNEPDSVPLHVDGDRLVGCIRRGHEEDPSLSGTHLLENLACKASGIMALRYALAQDGAPSAEQIDYVIGCGEEASGDRYQRGGGAMAKAIAAQAGCSSASGSDVKAYCCAPIHSLALAGATLQTGLFEHTVVIGGGSLAKLGMKAFGHLKRDMPIMEDCLAATAIVLGPDDGHNPVLRLDVVGKHPTGASSSPQAMADNLIVRPLKRAGYAMLDVDKYAVEMHDPDVTETAGSGNVPYNNYRIVGSVAIMAGELKPADLPEFERTHGMPGFSPTQGHIASAIPFVGHARDMMLHGEIERAMFVAKGSLFLGKITQQSDGMSILIERNPGVS